MARAERVPALAGGIRCALALLGAWLVVAVPVHAEAAPTGAAGVAEEIGLAGLGLGPQTVHGPRSSVSVFFPAPAAPAVAGSFVRIAAGYGPDVGPRSGAQVRVNGSPVGSPAVPADGSVHAVELTIPADDLRASAPNLLEVRFALEPARPGAAGDGLSAVLSDALLHYQLAPAGEPVDAVGLYPHSLLTAPAAYRSPVGLVLPPSPDAGELAAAMRVLADVGRHAWSRQVVPVVATSDQARWLAGEHGPAVAVGRLDDLPGVGAALRTAGSAGTLVPDDGVIAQTSATAPVIVLTGRTDGAVAAAADALIAQPEAGIDGPVAVVRPRHRPAHDPPRRVDLKAAAPVDEAFLGPGEHRVALGVAVPPVDRSAAGTLELAVSATVPAGAPRPSAVVEVGGQRIGGGELPGGADRGGVLGLRVPGRLLRPGMDGLAVRLDLPAVDASGPAGARILWERSLLTTGPPPTSAGGLEALPYPFLDAPRSPSAAIVVAGRLPDAIAPAAAVMAGLGARLVSTPPDVVVRTPDDAGVVPPVSIIVGAPPVGGRPGGLHLDFGAGGTVVVAAPPGPPSAWIREVDLPAQGVHALWVGGVGAQATANASGALRAGGLSGTGVSVGLDGSTRDVPASPPSMQPSIEARITRLLPLVALLGLLAEVGVVVLRARRWRRPR